MCPEPLAARELGAGKKSHAHQDFEDQNQIRVARSRCSEEPLIHRTSPPHAPRELPVWEGAAREKARGVPAPLCACPSSVYTAVAFLLFPTLALQRKAGERE